MSSNGRESSGKRGVLLSTLGNLSAPVASLITAPILAQTLGVDGRGALAAATAPLLLAAAGLTLGLPEAMTYFTAKRMARGRSILVNGLVGAAIAGIAGSVLISILAPILSGGNVLVGGLITIIGWAVAPSIMAGTIRGFMRGHQLWRLIALEQGLASLARVAAIVTLGLSGTLTPLTAGIVTAASSFVGVIVYLAAPSAIATRRPAEEAPASALPACKLSGSIIRFGASVWIGSVAGVLLSKLDQVLLLPLASAAALGLYAVAVSIADVVRVFNIAVRDVVFSTQAARQDDERLALASRVSTILTAFAAAAVWGLSWLLVPPLFGDDFSPSIELIGVLLLGTTVGNVGSVLAAGLSARGRPLLRSLAILVGVVINVIGLFTLAPHLGAMGAALAAAIANAATGIIVLAFAYRSFGLHPLLFIRFRRSDFSYAASSLRTVFKRGR